MKQANLYDLTQPVLLRSLKNLESILTIAQKNAKERTIDESVLFASRLAPDMFPFPLQIQLACIVAGEVVGGLSGKKRPDVPMDAKTFIELLATVKTMAAFVRGVKRSDYTGAESRSIPLFFDPSTEIPAVQYVQVFGLPDFYFHYTTAYAILRSQGVPLGKGNFIGSMPGLGEGKKKKPRRKKSAKKKKTKAKTKKSASKKPSKRTRKK